MTVYVYANNLDVSLLHLIWTFPCCPCRFSIPTFIFGREIYVWISSKRSGLLPGDYKLLVAPCSHWYVCSLLCIRLCVCVSLSLCVLLTTTFLEIIFITNVPLLPWQLSDPDAESPLNCDAGNMIRGGDQIAFHTMALMYTVENAHFTAWPPVANSLEG